VALATEIAVRLAATLTGTIDLGSKTVTAALPSSYVWTSGTGANQADLIFQDTRTLAASATENLDLAGVLTDGLGTTLTFAKIKAIIVTAASGNTNDVQVTRPASNGVPLFLAAGDGIPVKPGGCLAWVVPGTGITVTASTGDLLTFTNSAGSTSVDYSVVIIGTSA
jgi:hypothetical protein